MNDTEFIELLNLYLDHEISTADAARLESEVQTNIERRRIYQQYCRMQKACKLAAADFQSEPVVSAAASSDRKVVAFNPAIAAASRRKRTGSLFTMGTFAALAACAAIVFIGRVQQNSVTQPTTAATQPVAVVVPAAAVVSPDAAPPAASQTSEAATPRGLVSVPPRPQAMWVRDPLLLTGNTQAEAMRAAALTQANNQLAWIHAVQLEPLQRRASNDFSFTSTLQTEGGRALGGSRGSPVKQSEPAEESAAFRFVK
jgi:hypothetical protein